MIDSLAIHLGDAKTGSTSIQDVLSQRLWSAPGRTLCYPAYAPARNHTLLAKSLLTPTVDGQEEKHFGCVREEFLKSDAEIGLLSSEHLEFVAPEALDRALNAYLPEWREGLRLLVYIRPHADRLVSAFGERTKQGADLPSLEFLAQRFNRSRLLHYSERLERWRGVFGDALTIRPFTRTQLKSGDVVADFFEWLFGPPGAKIEAVDISNAALPLEDLAALRFMYREIRKVRPEAKGRLSSLGWRLAELLNARRHGKSTRLGLHRALAERLRETYADDAARVDREMLGGGSTMVDALDAAVERALPKPQSLRARDHLSQAEIGRLSTCARVFGGVLVAARQGPPARRAVSSPLNPSSDITAPSTNPHPTGLAHRMNIVSRPIFADVAPRVPPDVDLALSARAEAAVCDRLGVTTIPYDPAPARRFFYVNRRFEICGDLARAASGKLDYFWVPPAGQFGNNLIQMLNAIAVAEKAGIATLYHPFPWLPAQVTTDRGLLILRSPPDLANGLAGVRNGFFVSRGAAWQDMKPVDYLDVIQRVIRPNLAWHPVGRGRDVVTVHVRGGDVMIDRNPNSWHWQPPLAFYTKAITSALELTQRSAVQVVSVDRSNPILDELEEWALNQGLETDVSSGSFSTDAARLLSADYMVASNSSFAHGLALLSTNLRGFWFFRNAFHFRSLVLAGVDVTRGQDLSGTYIPGGEWRNTIAQRREMVLHPEEDVVLEKLRR